MKILHSVTASTNTTNPLIADVTTLLQKSEAILSGYVDDEFDPFELLDDNNMSTQMVRASVAFEAAIQEAVDEYRKATSSSIGLKYD